MTTLEEHIIVAGAENHDCDVQATNIILHGLPPDVYALVNHQEAAKYIWDRVKLLMKGTELSYQEHWSKFATYVKLAKSLYTTNYDQLYAYLSQYERHANEVPFQTEDLDAYDSNCDELSSAKAVLIENLSIYDPDVLFEVPYSDSYLNDMINQDVQEMQYSEQTHIHNFQDNEIHSDSNINPVIAKEHDVISVIDDEETLILEEESRSKMLDKQNYPISIENKIKISPIDYLTLNKIKEDFAHSQEKDTVIRNLKDRIKSLSGKDSVENVKKDIDEIETINIELEHSVGKLLSEIENLRKEREHLKSIYKDQFDSIRKTRVQSKEHCDSLIAQINAKSIENSDLNAQLQEKVFAIAALKNKLRKLKGKNFVDTAVSKPNVTIALGMFKLDIEPISHRLKNNTDADEVYIEKTIENTDTLHGFVERART
ncbi:hypothetical protein Tco_0174368 [Tanacetum coccineum]